MNTFRVISAVLLSVAMTGPIHAADPSVRMANVRLERCVQLHQQLDTALATKHAASRVAGARALGRSAAGYCAHHKEAQGALTYAKALALFGIKPRDMK